ncbi:MULTISPECIES: hypothetical protein [unclassified Rhizobium]|uniref:hypothetical protein n=1 Tax=unclassified Rhizobium TaxID=2613769 RepID=UPI000FF0E750|nr:MULTISPECIES: hypothetical protein [unclassified Rhizobium]NKJ08511.1 hypothetical protein [Rhizobium sp. SG741]RKD50439.1 hypothetical protein BJ928_12125 [Rhizobium sp. WW_1]
MSSTNVSCAANFFSAVRFIFQPDISQQRFGAAKTDLHRCCNKPRFWRAGKLFMVNEFLTNLLVLKENRLSSPANSKRNKRLTYLGAHPKVLAKSS